MKKSIPLDEQIVAVLRGTCTSEQAAAVLADAKRELSDLTQRADSADVASLDPLATAAEAKKLRTEAGDHRFEADRMEASVSALEARLADLKQAESDARHEAAKAEAKAARDKLAEEIRKEYPELVRKLASLAKRIDACDAQCRRFGLESAEAIGRGIRPNFYEMSQPLLRISQCAPAMPDGKRLAWDAPMGSALRYWALEASEEAQAA